MFSIPSDPESLKIARHIGMVLKVASKYQESTSRYGLEIDDLVSEGLIAVWQALQRYDPRKGVTEGSYVWQMIHWRIFVLLRRERSRIRFWPKNESGEDVDLPQHDPDSVDDAEEVAWVLVHLPPRLRQLMEKRYGLNGPPMLLEEIAQEMGCTRQNVHNHVSQGLRLARAVTAGHS